MIRTVGKIATILFGLAAAMPVHAAKEPLVLPRTGPWEVNYDANSCHLIGTFGSGADEVIAQFTRTKPSDGFQLALQGRTFASKEAEYAMTLDFGLATKPVETKGTAGLVDKVPVVLARARLDGWDFQFDPKMSKEQNEAREKAAPRITPQQEAKVTRLIAELPRKRVLQLRLGAMNAPMASLRTCMDDLLRTWGYDPTVIASLSREPTPVRSPGEWLTTNDYPKGALLRGEQAMIDFRLDVNVDGRATGCTILLSTKPTEMNGTTCSTIMRRAKFLPALDAQGNPVKSFYINTVRWQLPG